MVELGGGAGNPGVASYSIYPKRDNNWTPWYFGTKASNGTGGLLIIKADIINNLGRIKSNGSNGANTSYSGGSSGGGSINIFYSNRATNKGLYDLKGGTTSNGGAGGNGTITIGNISTGTFVKDE